MSRNKQVSKLVESLVKGANDGTPKVKATIADSLTEIGKHEPNLVLTQCHEYIDTGKEKDHVIALLTVMHRILQIKLDDVEVELAITLIKQALSEMTKDKQNVVPEWQGKASSVLVDLGMRFPDKVIAAMMELFGPGVIPHYFVVKTLGDLAIANPVGVVPVLADVFSRMLPVLASIKMDNIRWVFASSFGCFCDAITSYKVTAPPGGTDVATFAPHAFTAYELMFATWLQSKEKKVRLVTIQAIGSMCMVMAATQLDGQLLKLIPTFTNLYRKEKPVDFLPITQGFCNLLSVATQGDTATVLEPMRDGILNTLFPLVCKPPDFADSAQIKNHNEILRSIEILAKRWMDEVLAYLFSKLESKDPQIRNGTLVMLKHLVTRTQPKLEGKKELIVTGLKPLVDNENDLSVKKSLAQVIISMANEDYLSLYGGESLIEFIILTSSITDEEIKKWQDSQAKKKQVESSAVSPGELRAMCDHILSLMTTTIPSVVDALWPYLLEPLTKPRFTSAMAVVAKCISHISEIKRQSQAANYMIDFSHTSSVNLPKPPEIMARLFVLSHLPFRRGSLALYLLKTLQHLGPMLHANISSMWDGTIPKLVDYLEKLVASESKTEADVTKWEGLVRRLLTETIKLVNDDMWTMEMCDAALNQFALHENDPGAKKVAYKMVGVLLSLISHKEYIKRTLDRIFGMVNHTNDDERTGLAQGYGFCGSSHLDIVLEQQSNEIKGTGPVRKETKSSGGGSGGGFLSSLFGGDKQSTPSSSSKGKSAGGGSKTNTLILSYGYITAYAKPSYITSRLDIHIINNMLPHCETNDLKLQQTIIQSMDLVAQSVTPEHLQAPFIFKHRDAFIIHLVSYLRLHVPGGASQKKEKKEEKKVEKKNDKKEDSKPVPSAPPPPTLDTISINNTKIKISVLALNACSTLGTLDPPLPGDIEQDLVSVIAQYYTVQKEASTPAKEKDKPEAEPGVEGEDEANLDLIFLNLDRLMITILTKDPSIACLKRLTAAITPFFSSPDGVQRTRSLNTFVRLLKKYVDLSTAKKPTDRAIEGLGKLLSCMLPRFCDPTSEIRGLSLEAAQLLFYIEWMLTTIVEAGDKALPDIDLRPPKTLGPLTGLRKKMTQLEDQNEQFGLAHSTLSPLLAKLTSTQELPSLIMNGLAGLVDSQVAGARGTCVIIFGIVSVRGADLHGHVIPIVKGLIDKMLSITNEQTLNGTLHALKSIANLHLQDTMDAILSQEIPHKPHVSKVMQLLARDTSLVLPVVKFLTDLLNNGDLMEDADGPAAKPDPASKEKGIPLQAKEQVPTKESQAATICLCEMLVEEELEEVIQSNFALFFNTLALRVGTTCGHASSEQTMTLWKNFFTVLQEEDVLEKLAELGTLNKLTDKVAYVEGITTLTGLVVKRHSTEMRSIFKGLQPYLKANFNGQRFVSAYTLGEMVNHINTDTELLDQLITHLLTSLVDPLLKIPSLRGLSNIVSTPVDQINKYAPTILDALMSSIDDRLDDVALESMNGLAKVFKVVDETRIAPVLINICHRIRPAFDNPNDKIRASAAALFAGLARFGEGIAKDSFYEQIHSNLPSVVLHINDDNEEVQKAFKKVLFEVGPLLHNENLSSILTTSHIFSTESDIDYADFIHMHFAKALIAGWPDRLNSYVQTCINPYFTSEWDVLKANAVYFIGSIMGHIPEEIRKDVGINSGHTAKALIGLLTEKSPIVRQKAAEAMGMLWSY